MTGFGQADAENGECRVAVSVRSVNHRFLDLAIRLAEEYRDLEPELRKILDRRVARGRVELRVAVELFDEGETRVSLDEAVVAGLLKAAGELEAMGLATGDLAAGDLLRLPEVVRVHRRPGTLGDEGRRSDLRHRRPRPRPAAGDARDRGGAACQLPRASTG